MDKILLIDDKKENHYLIERIVEEQLSGIKVLSKQSGEEGIKAARKEHPDVIILDLSMPGINGFEVCSKLNSETKTMHIPILVISGVMTDIESKIKALDLGAVAFLAKPFEPAELIAQIKMMLRIKKTEDKLRNENIVLSTAIKKDSNKFDFSLDKYKKVFDNNYSGIIETALDGKIISCNTAFAKMMGFRKISDVIGLYILDFYKDKSERDLILKTLKQDKKIINYSIEALDKNGNTIYVLISLFLMEDKSILTFIVDISTLKKSEKKIEEKEQRYKDLIDNINDFICTHDLEGIILSANPAAEKMLGYPLEQIINNNFRKFLAPEVQDQFDDYIKKIKSEGKAKGLMIIQTGSGEKRVWEYDNSLSTENIEKPFVRGFARDITELKQKTQLLKMSEKKYKDLFEKSDDAILIIKNGKFVDCNNATVKMLRYKNKEELLNTHPSVLSPEFQPDGKPSFEKADEMMKLAFEKGSHRFEWDHKKADGEVFPVEVLLTAIAIDEEEKILHTVWRDITIRKKEENDLLELQQRLKSHLDNSPLAGIFWDVNFKVMDWNKSAERIFGYSKEEALGKHANELIVPEEIKPQIDNVFTQLLKQVGGNRSTNENINKDGKRILCEWYNVAIKDTKGNVTGVASLVDDVTEQKKSELKQNAIYSISESAFTASDMYTLYKRIHEIISTLLPVKNIYIALHNEETGILSFPYFVDEYDPQQADKKLGKGLTEYVLRTGEACLVDEKKDLELREKGEVEIIGAPTKIWLGVPLKVSGKTIGVIVVQDYEDETVYGEDEKQLLLFVSKQIAQVIERKQNSVQLKKYAEELREANKTKDKFFSIIAHDLKSPFQGLLGYSQILSTEYPTLSEEEKLLFINNIDAISKNAYSLLEDLLTWSRLQTGKLGIKLESLNLYEELNGTISLLSQTALNKDIKLNSEIDKNIVVKADKNMLCTVVRNILSNAIKFTHKGGEITISSRLLDNFAEINVLDNGVGIDKDNIEKIFAIDKSITTKGTANEEGTGLGLLLCKEMIEKHGGNIRVESEVGKGSNFIFTIPLDI